jgi:outer membrane protein
MAEPDLSEEEQAEIKKAIEEYQERSWELGLAAGYGVRTNPLVNSDDIPMYAVINVAWFGDQFFFDNGDLGLTIHETEKLSVNFIAHVNDERGIFEWLNNSRLGVQFFASEASGDFSPPIDNQGMEEETPVEDNSSEYNSELEAEMQELDCCSDFDSETQTQDDFPPDNLIADDERLNQNQETIEIPRRSFAVDGGLEIMYADDWGDLQLQVLSDISFTHKGVEVWVSYAYPWRHGNWKFVPSVGINWKSSNLLDYYYGVRKEEANQVRPAYRANSGFNSFAKLSLSYRINDNWGVVGVAKYEALSRSIRESPIVDSQSIETLFIGIMYNF